jgi:hypothetical protein
MYKIGDKVLIKDKNWYNLLKDVNGTVTPVNYHINCCHKFDYQYAEYCGKVLTIDDIRWDGSFRMKEEQQLSFEDWMFEKIVEPEVKISDVLDETEIGSIFYNKILGKVILIKVTASKEYIVKKLDSSDDTEYTFDHTGLLMNDYRSNHELFELYPNEQSNNWKDFNKESDFQKSAPKSEGYFYYIDTDGEIKTMVSDRYSKKQMAMFDVRNYFLSKEMAMNSDLYKTYHKQ